MHHYPSEMKAPPAPLSDQTGDLKRAPISRPAPPAAHAAPSPPVTSAAKPFNLFPGIPAVTTVNFCAKLPCHGGIPTPSPVSALGEEYKEFNIAFNVALEDLAAFAVRFPQQRNSDHSVKSDLSIDEIKRNFELFFSKTFFSRNEKGLLVIGVLPGQTLPPLFLPRLGKFCVDKTTGLVNSAQNGCPSKLVQETLSDTDRKRLMDVDASVEMGVAAPYFVEETRWINGREVTGIATKEAVTGGRNGTFLHRKINISSALDDGYLKSNPNYLARNSLDLDNIQFDMEGKKVTLFHSQPEHSGDVIDTAKYRLKMLAVNLQVPHRQVTVLQIPIWTLTAYSFPYLYIIIPIKDGFVKSKMDYATLHTFVKDFPDKRAVDILTAPCAGVMDLRLIVIPGYFHRDSQPATAEHLTRQGMNRRILGTIETVPPAAAVAPVLVAPASRS